MTQYGQIWSSHWVKEIKNEWRTLSAIILLTNHFLLAELIATLPKEQYVRLLLAYYLFFFACCEWDVTRRRLSIQIECVTGSDIVELKSSINICNVLRDVCVCPGRDTNDEVKKVTEKMKKMTSKRCYGYNNNCTLNRFQRNQLLEMWNSYKQTFCHISSSSVGHEWNKRENDRENGKN